MNLIDSHLAAISKLLNEEPKPDSQPMDLTSENLKMLEKEE